MVGGCVLICLRRGRDFVTVIRFGGAGFVNGYTILGVVVL